MKKIKELIDNPELCGIMGFRAKRKAIKQCSASVCASKLENIYRKILNAKN